MRRKNELPQLKLPEAALLWDERENDWQLSWRRNFKRQKTVIFIDNITFNDVITVKTSNPFYSAPYATFLLLHKIVVTATPTDIVIEIEFSDDKVNWYKYIRTPFGDLRWEDAAGDKLESIDGLVLAPWLRVKVTATGTTAVNKFTSTVKLILNG